MVPIQNILVPTDFSEPAAVAGERALDLARLLDAKLHVLHAYSLGFFQGPGDPFVAPQGLADAVRDAAAAQLAQVAQRAVDCGVPCQTHLQGDYALGAILALAEGLPADLIVMGTRGLTGLKHVALGSLAERTVRLAPCPVLTVKGEARGPLQIRNILVATDFSEDSEAALARALELAESLGARLHLLHAYSANVPSSLEVLALPRDVFAAARASTRARLQALASRLAAVLPDVQTHMSPEDPVSAIAELARTLPADLVVTGTRGRTGIPHVLFGSVAERTVRVAPCPVLTVKAPQA